MLEKVDLTPHDHDAQIARAGIEQHERNRNEIFRRLGLLSIRGGMEVIDPEKLAEFIQRLKLDAAKSD